MHAHCSSITGRVLLAATMFCLAAISTPLLAPGQDKPEGGPLMCGEPTSDGCSGMDYWPEGGDGVVNIDELLVVINHWGENGTASGIRPPGDCFPFITGNCVVNIDDLIQTIRNWGSCPQGACCLPDSSCAVLTAFACTQQGGTFTSGAVSCYNQSLCPTAQPNDDCANAFTTLGTWYNNHATTDGPSGVPGNTCEELMVRDLWYRRTVNCAGISRFWVDGMSQMATVIAVYDGWTCPPGPLLGCAIGSDDHYVDLVLEPGRQVTIRIGTTVDSPAGTGSVSVSCFLGE